MELTKYQKRVIGDLDHFLGLLNETHDTRKAYMEHWYANNVPVGFGGMLPYNNELVGTPHVCFKVPTGGGKTFLACASVKHIMDALGLYKTKVVAWLVPSNAILEQTILALKNPDHPYRARLDVDFGGKVEVYTKEELLNGQNFNPTTVREHLTLCVLSFDSLRSKKKDGRKVYDENGALAQFVPYYTSRETLVEAVDDTALIQVLNQMSPVVIVDESHNAQSDLSIEMLRNLNPSFVLDLTATPRKNSNIISIVDARELKAENMVKLPVIVYNRSSKLDVLRDAIQLRGTIERQAMAEEQQRGTYIRPIVLFQAQPRGKEDAATFEKLKAELISMGIPKEQIAIKTSERNELKGVELRARTCQIRYIITVNALKEGWDCPFAFILATLANKTSQVDVEQILGRILRLPYARKHTGELLNMSYVLTCSADFRATLENIIKGLNRAGFSDKEFRVAYDATAMIQQKEPEQIQMEAPTETQNESAHVDLEDFLDIDFSAVREALENSNTLDLSTEIGDVLPKQIAEMISTAKSQGAEFDAAIAQANADGLPIGGVNDMKNFYPMQPAFEKEVAHLELPIFQQEVAHSIFINGTQVKLSKEALAEGFTLHDKDAAISFELAQGDIYRFDVSAVGDAIPRYQKMSTIDAKVFKTYLESLPPESRIKQCVNAIVHQLNKLDGVESSDLRKYIERIVANMSSDNLAAMEGVIPSYALRIRQKIEQLMDEYRERRFNAMVEAGEITCRPGYILPKVIDPINAVASIAKSLYTAEADMNDFEHNVIAAISGLNNVVWWHRIIERRGFCLNGFINHYPDFMVQTTRGRIVLIETKGDHLWNDESRRKLHLGRKWQELCGQNYRYYMVFDDKDAGIEGAYKFAQFIETIKRL
ncbi:MAG: DEAD/DEAH box helicase family protein [Candidatus Limiplasma sp.]|nr:DEAD/DEAH box helicase family protein [Candidatus Limiplasma sp.]